MFHPSLMNCLGTDFFFFLAVYAGGPVEEEACSWDQSPKIVRGYVDNVLYRLILLILFSPFPSITSYGDRPNAYENVSEYFRSHFMQVHRRKDIAKRSLYVVGIFPPYPTLTPFHLMTFSSQHFTSMLVRRALCHGLCSSLISLSV